MFGELIRLKLPQLRVDYCGESKATLVTKDVAKLIANSPAAKSSFLA